MNVEDYSLSRGEKARDLAAKLSKSGFQASELGRAIELMREMRADKDCTIFLAFTANLVASGLRGVIAQAVREGLADAVITTGGAIDHDLIKSHKPYLQGDFFADDAALHKRGVNRLGNILVPNDRYVLLEKKIQPLLEKAYRKNKVVSPKGFIELVAGTLRDKNSFLRACRDRKVPVFSPSLIDSAIGLQFFMFKQDHGDLALDETGDMLELGRLVLQSKRTGAVILGGGAAKHFTIGANILKEGLDYAVYFTTATPFDGSLSGAVTNEAKSWGKIAPKAKHVTVFGDATILFPLALSAVL